MEKNGFQYTQTLNLNSNSVMKRPSNMQLYDDVDIDKYMSLVEDELKRWDYSLHSRAFIENIINILDKLSEPKKFNKTIFFHILEHANLDKENQILLLDFFRSFFTVYESMKRNREKFAVELNNYSQRIELIKNKIRKFQNDEVVTEDGMTNNSRVKIKNEMNSLNEFYDNLGNDNINFKFVFKFGNKTENLEINSLDKKTYFKIDTLSDLEQPIRVFLEEDGNQIFIEKINVRNILDEKYNLEFTHKNTKFNLSFIWINSKVTYYNKELGRLEGKINEDKENIHVLNNCLVHIEETFKKYFSQPQNKQVEVEVKDFKGTLDKELEITQKIEDYVLHIVGKEVLVMDKIVFLLNKVLIPLLIFVFLYRFDISTALACMLLLGVEFRFVMREHCYKILIIFVISFVLDILWIIYYLTKLGSYFPHEQDTSGETIRDFAVICNIPLSLIKLILIFCLWRMTLELKLSVINRQNSLRNRNPLNPTDTFNAERIESSKAENLRKSNLKSVRPQLKSSLLPSQTVSLRTFEEEVVKK